MHFSTTILRKKSHMLFASLVLFWKGTVITFLKLYLSYILDKIYLNHKTNQSYNNYFCSMENNNYICMKKKDWNFFQMHKNSINLFNTHTTYLKVYQTSLKHKMFFKRYTAVISGDLNVDSIFLCLLETCLGNDIVIF